MDNKNPEEQSSSSAPPSSPNLESKKSTTLQPSESFLNELSSNPSPNPKKPLIELVNQDLNKPPVSAEGPASVYPMPIDGPGANSTIPATGPIKKPESSDKTAPSKKDNTLAIAIIAVGILIAAPAVFGLLHLSKFALPLGSFDRGYGVVIYIIYALYALLGVGIILRKEVARQIYVVLAVIGLIFSVYFLIKYTVVLTRAQVTNGNVLSTTDAQQITGTQNTITTYQNNKQLPQNQKNQIILELQKNLQTEQAKQKADQKAYKGLIVNELTAIIPDLLISIVPLIFLTRPRVKELFG